MGDLPVTARVAVDAAAYWIDRPFDYLIPPGLTETAVPGVRVVVPFGRGNHRTEGIILSLGPVPEGKKLKSIVSVLDSESILSPELLRLAVWVRDRYFCTVYNVVHAMLPAGLWYQMEGMYSLCSGIDRESAYDAAGKSGQEKNILDAVFAHGGSCPVRDIQRVLEPSDPARALQSLVKKESLRWTAGKSAE